MNKHTPTPWEVGNGTEIYCHENGDWISGPKIADEHQERMKETA